MEIAVPIVVGLVLVLLLVVVALGAVSRQAGTRKAAVEDPDIETLRYAVPAGQDPAVLMTALTQAGHQATSEMSPTGHDLLIACPVGKRDEIRSVIGNADTTSIEGPGPRIETGPIRFADE
jgi:hypothetical protein